MGWPMFATRNFQTSCAIHLALTKTFNDFVPHVFVMLPLVAYNFNTGFFSLADPSNQIIDVGNKCMCDAVSRSTYSRLACIPLGSCPSDYRILSLETYNNRRTKRSEVCDFPRRWFWRDVLAFITLQSPHCCTQFRHLLIKRIERWSIGCSGRLWQHYLYRRRSWHGR